MTKPLDPPAALRPLDAIRSDLEHPHTAALLAVRAESVGDGPIGRLLRDVGPIVDRLAAVERERDAAMNERDAAELMVRRLADQAVSDEARIAAVEARAAFESSALDESYRRGFNNAMAQIRAVLAASPTPTGVQDQVGAATIDASNGPVEVPAPTPTGPEPEAWAVDLIDCGRDDGVQVCATWAEADAFRRSYIASAEGMQHCERTAIIRHAAAGTRLGYHDRAPYFVGPATPTEPTEETP